MQDTIGFIGLGAMGRHMVPHLLRAGFAVFVCDTSEQAAAAMVAQGAVRCDMPRQVGDSADVVLTCLPTPDVVEQVVVGENGVAEGGRVRVVVDHSTTGPSMARSLARRLGARGIASLDAPLAGGVPGAEAGTLSVMVGGDAQAYARCEPVFRSFGRKVVHVGREPGLGQVLKLVNNMTVAATLVATTEAVLFGIKSGLEAGLLLDMLNASTARSFASESLLGQDVVHRRFDFGFRIELMRKDLRLFLQEAEAAGTPAFTSALTKQFFDHAIAAGHADHDMTHVVQVLERMAGVEIAR
ncbi:NAD(P)-dependent oxidoreductase [Variovorax sp. JS1663]|uniref:NAD(P)-dependent oxidoreductase n=1 Tax=Variovorax sp. JS1663 TaxID=1851577 RepID=UPI000B344CEA|nr:NAD(P)-dependent oxidoreductase [Variovorax sp. JS1663]OUL99611.1 hydroxyacid dehydrogenase [Variovorax sp. JS1663]